jgi:hypothetical protein
VLGDEPRPEVVYVTGGIAGDNPNRLALKIGCLRLHDGTFKEKNSDCQKQRLHACPPMVCERPIGDDSSLELLRMDLLLQWGMTGQSQPRIASPYDFHLLTPHRQFN